MVTFTQLPTPPLLLFCLAIVVVVTHTTWPQHTVHTHPHTRGTHCYHTQVIIVKPSQTKHDLLNGSIPFNLFPINWKKSNGQCTISQVAKRERVEEREGYRGEWRSNKTRKGRLHFSRVLRIVSCFPTPTCFFAS